jgi:predicted GH43/DUF377 family glycosyl hydrolase
MTLVPVTRTQHRFLPDARRVITKPFIPGDDVSVAGRSRVGRILSRILDLSEAVVVSNLDETRARFSGRHADFAAVLEQHFVAVAHHVQHPNSLSPERRQLIGAYFTSEYSIDAAALSNPSIVRAPDQTGVGAGACRFVMSLRAIGEGHVSSIQFRSGVIDAEGQIVMDAMGKHVRTAERRAPLFDKPTFRTKLTEIHSFTETTAAVLESIPEHFTMAELESAMRRAERASDGDQGVLKATRTMHWLASSNYQSSFDPASSLSERVLFPAGPTESHGMEDARFVRFTGDDGAVTYYASYSAYDGYQVLPQLIETTDFASFRVATLNGPCAINKGIALFPRKLDGRFVALARLDNENNHLIRSDSVHFWFEREDLQSPEWPWELIQLGNCGSPLETEAGWLVITHGVGPLRQYVLGAILLDIHDPVRVIGRLREPLLSPAADERDGYTPNVVYSCGSMIVDDRLILPYGFSDVGARIATLRVSDLLTELTRDPA